MADWKTAFLKSLDPKRETEESYIFGPPASAQDLAELESKISGSIPANLKEFLSEINGIKTADGETFFFSTSEMPEAIEYYREWDWPTDMLLSWSKNILYVCQENGFASMWGIVHTPFADFKPGQVIAFDHDVIGEAESPEELFVIPYTNLVELVEANYKSSS